MNNRFLITLFIGLGLSLTLPIGQATAQTPVTNIENAAGDSVLTIFDDGGFAVYGEEFTGTIPATGDGTRLMWHPAKAAFRAGETDGSQWEDANIGSRSVALGSDTEASGEATFAMGFRTLAATEYSLTIGANNAANRGNDDNDQTTGPLFVVGNGTSVTSRSDALVLHQNGDMVISGSLTQNSDRRLKTNINPLGDEILGKLSTITPSRFEFKNQQTHPAGQQIGLIAQEMQKQFPELVSEAGNGYLSVSYSKFTAVLLKGIQEQQQTIENQQTTIDQLKKKTRRIAALEKQVSEIKSSRQMAGMPVSTIGILLLGIAIGGGFWWRSSMEKSRQN